MSSAISFRVRGTIVPALALVAILLGALAAAGAWPARARGALDVRKLPMRFEWVACEGPCRGWVSATGVITAETPKAFEAFARAHDLTGATVVLDSSGGSVNDAIALGRRWRALGVLTTVGATIDSPGSASGLAAVAPDASCESMCVFLLLSGKVRYVPPGARVRVHQIWMGDRAEDARAASYSAQDLMIVERDIGRLAKYTFEMGGTGDLLELALGVPPWEALHELSPAELSRTNVVTTDAVADVFPRPRDDTPAMARLPGKPVQDRIVSGGTLSGGRSGEAALSPVGPTTRTAEAAPPASTAVKGAALPGAVSRP